MTTQTKKTKRKSSAKKQVVKTAKQSGKNETGNAPFVVELDPVITISEAEKMYEKLQGYLDRGGDITVDASQVHMIDTAGLQLLLAFTIEVKNQNRTISWKDVSPGFMDTAELLGLAGLLGATTTP